MGFLSGIKGILSLILYFCIRMFKDNIGHDCGVFLKLLLFSAIVELICAALTLISIDDEFFSGVITGVASGICAFYTFFIMMDEFGSSGTLLKIYMIIALLGCASAAVGAFALGGEM